MPDSLSFDASQQRSYKFFGNLLLLAGLSGALTGCMTPAPAPLSVSAQHLSPAAPVAGRVPEFAFVPPMPKPPRPSVRQEVYSVVMKNVNVQDLLFALARDAKFNIDIHPGISGSVTMNVHDQTLTEILERVARQVDMRYEVQGINLSIQPDTPYLKHYRVDYPNIQRDAKSSISTSTNVASTGGSATAGGAGGAGGSNASTSSIENISNNHFWGTLHANLTDLLRETDKVLPKGDGETLTQQNSQQTTTGTGASNVAKKTARSPIPLNSMAALAASANPTALQSADSTVVRRTSVREAASVISNPETGNISVRATQSQHAKVREFLDQVLIAARRQVLIEATIVEVDLSHRYQQGIDWSLLQTGGINAGSGITIKPSSGGSSGLQTGGVVSSIASLNFKQLRLWNGDTDLSAMLSLLESFGTLRVLSSPKVSVLNNQSSVLKVVDNKVYFNISVTQGTPATATAAATPSTYTTTINTVPIGFIMTVVPQVSQGNEVTLNLRPTISRITSYATDPNPVLAQNNLVNRIPEVQTREMESVLRVQSGDVAILGGLMQDTRNNNSDEVPGLNRLSGLGELFKYRNDSSSKSELVIFLRPTVLKDASLEGDLRDFRALLPNAVDAMREGIGSSSSSRWVN